MLILMPYFQYFKTGNTAGINLELEEYELKAGKKRKRFGEYPTDKELKILRKGLPQCSEITQDDFKKCYHEGLKKFPIDL